MSKRILHQKIFAPINNHIIDYPTPINLSYAWSFGALAGICLVIQIITGIFLAMHYCSNIELAFSSVERIMRDVNGGWLLRYLHANGASFFFVVVYLHIGRGLYYGSFLPPRQHLWASGIVIFLLLMATAFIGYVLPWGQMSLWGATVITSLFSSIPVIGADIVSWLWGGFSVGNPTLSRFFSLHYLLPFIIAALSFIHLYLLHLCGSNNPVGVLSSTSLTSFSPYFVVKDLFVFCCFALALGYFVFFEPNLLGDSDNYILANPLSTPEAIIPEWYFLPFYAILRSIPDKLLGVVAMFLAIVFFLILPFTATSKIRSTRYRPIYRLFFGSFVTVFLCLVWIGAKSIEYPYVTIGQVLTVSYFFLLVFGIPFCEWIENSWVRRTDKAILQEYFDGTYYYTASPIPRDLLYIQDWFQDWKLRMQKQQLEFQSKNSVPKRGLVQSSKGYSRIQMFLSRRRKDR